MKKIYIVTIVVGTLFIVGLALSGSITLIDNRTFASEERAIYAANQASMPDGAPISLRANGQGKSQLGLGDGREMATVYVGAEAKRELENRSARPLALAAGDVDEDGVPDLVSGYASDDANLLVIHRGNVDAIYADTPEANERKARGEFTDAPFLSPARVFELPERPDLIGTGDFNADGHRDVVVAALGSQRLYWLAGDGHGGLGDAQTIELPGKVTAMTVGEMNRADGLDDIVVGISGEQGAQALIFEGAEGALKHEPEAIALPAEVTALALGQLDEQYEMDLAVAAGHELLIVHGRDRCLSVGQERQAEVKPATIEEHTLPFHIVSLAVGDFSGDPRTEIAVLSTDGVVQVLGQDAQSKQWGTRIGEVATRNHSEAAGAAVANDQPTAPLLVRARISVSGYDDLVVLNQDQHQLQIVTSSMWREDGQSAAESRAPVALAVEGEPVAVLPMRLNLDALSDLVLLKRGGESPLAAAMTAPTATFTVNNTGDQSDILPGNGRCETVANNGQCTLRAAIQETNASAGADLITFSVPSITLTSTLPNITDAVTIDGGTNRTEISGPGLTLTGGNSVVQRLVLNRLLNTAAAAINMTTKGSNRVEGCYIGTNVAGTATAFGSNSFLPGILNDTSPGNIIGGTTAAARNVLVAQTVGVGLVTKSPNTKVQGNYIGTDAAGTTALGGDTSVSAAFTNANANPNLMVGGTDPGAGNVMGKVFFKGESGMLIQGNLIGTNAAGTAAFVTTGGNGAGVGNTNGIAVTGLTVGGTTPAARNVISGWGLGIQAVNITAVLVQGNYIGTDKDGTRALGNSIGVQFLVFDSTLGGTVTGARNLVSGSKQGGVGLFGTNNLALGNFIGTDVNGTANLGNTGDGVTLSGDNNRVGGAESGAANIIAFNNPHGVNMFSGGNSVRQNSIFSNGPAGSAGGGILSFAKAPVLATTAGVTRGTLSGAARNTLHTIEFFSNPTCGADTQGKTYIPSDVTVTTDANGAATFNVPAGQNVTATANNATTTDYGTSPFSNCGGTVTDSTDTLTLDRIAPPANSDVSGLNLKTTGLKANVTYLLASKPNALLALRVFDQDGFLIGSSVVEQKARPNPAPSPLPNEDFVIPGVQTDCPNPTCSPIQLRKNAAGELLSTTLTMQAYFIDPLSSTVIKKSAPITYNVVADVKLLGLEVTQAVQDLKNSVPLVADKRTFVRAYVRATSPDVVGAVMSASLVGTNSNGVTNGRLIPSNPGRTVTVTTIASRSYLLDSFYFELPPDWIKAGNLQFRIESTDASFVCEEPDGTPNCATTVTFNAVNPLSMKFITMTYKDAADVAHTPNLADISRATNEFLGRYPINRIDSGDAGTATTTLNPCLDTPALDTNFQNLRKELNDMRNTECQTGTCKQLYLGLLADKSGPNCGTNINGEGDLPGNAAAVFAVTGDTMPRIHEIGHVMGFKHTNFNGTEGCGDGAVPPTDIPCTKLEGDGTLGLTKDQYDPNTAYGFDINDSSPTQIYVAETADFMSYGRPRWVSRANYIQLYNKFKINTALNELTENVNVVSAAQTVLIDGSVLLDGTGGSIGSVYVSNNAGSVTLPSPGFYAIRFENAQGVQLATYSFNPVAGSVGGEDPAEDQIAAAQNQAGNISLQLPWDTATKRIVLLRNGQVLASRQASANSPVVRVTSPNGGETLNGASTTFTWTASDEDGDSLTYLLEYSKDNGTTWKALAVNWKSTSFPVDLTNLPGSNQALFRVTASDGFNTTQDQSDAVFTVPAHAPQAFISTPDNNHLYVGDQTVILNGMAIDIEDGILDSSSLSWSSNLNGPLGTGSSLAINASTLAEGTHTITLSASDSTARVGTTSISIRIFRTRPAFAATLSIGPGGLVLNASSGTAQSAPQTIAIRNSGDGALTWSAAADQPWIRLGSTSGSAPSNLSITANPTGLAVGQYTGNVTITSAGSVNSPQTVQVAFSVIAPVAVSGRVLTSDGRGLRNATVSITNSSNVTQFATTSSFGFFSFDNVAVGQTYTVRISSRLFRFGTQTIQVNGNLTVPDFVGLE